MASLDKANTAAPVSSHATEVIGSEVVGSEVVGSAKSTKTFRNPQRYRPGPIEGLPIREIRRAKEAQFRRVHKAFKLKLNIRRNNRGTPSPDFLEINFPETRSMMERIKSSINKPIGYHIRFNDMIQKNYPRHHEELMRTINLDLDNFVHRMNNRE